MNFLGHLLFGFIEIPGLFEEGEHYLGFACHTFVFHGNSFQPFDLLLILLQSIKFFEFTLCEAGFMVKQWVYFY